MICDTDPAPVLKEAQPALSLSDVQKDADRYCGRVVVWGVVIETLNRRDETVLDVMQTDLDFQKRPTAVEKSPGRFMVRCKGLEKGFFAFIPSFQVKREDQGFPVSWPANPGSCVVCR